MKRPSPLLIALFGAIGLITLYKCRVYSLGNIQETRFYLATLALLVAYGLRWIITAKIDPDRRVSKMPRGVKVAMASFLLVWGLLLLTTIILLPFIGPSALKLLIGVWSPVIWIIGALLLIPFVENRLQ